MEFPTRRALLAGSGAVAGLAAPPRAFAVNAPVASESEVSLDGVWQFRREGQTEWREVRVPHTWQVEPETAEYFGVAWYRREFDVPASWRGKTVRVEFEAVFHSARVEVNGRAAGEHAGKGYTTFAFDITPLLRFDAANTIAVRVDNAFLESMLPRARSYDWTPDGGIYRPVRLLLTPPVYIERVDVQAVPDLAAGTARVAARAVVHGGSADAVRYEVIDEGTGRRVAGGAGPFTLRNPKLWHFDRPHLYRLRAVLGEHAYETTFGIREIKVRDGGLYLNGERVWLAGVERMAGSHPAYGMAEPAAWIEHDHRDMRALNCVFTRVHWQQDRRVLDWCDRNGMLIQEEVPTWGPDTFKGMDREPSAAIMNNGLEQLREMIARDRNHPSIVSWGLCNEIGGQNPAAAQFARRMLREAKRLDPDRLCSYASNSLQSTPERDVAGEMDFIEWNEYYESWYGGDVASVRKNVEAIRRAFPGKMIVVSEYGYCECAEGREGGDAARARILREHNEVFREFPEVGGLIFFSYNDYRTHIGDKGVGAMKQRVHGVVDLFGSRKPSYEVLRNESSPVAEADCVRRDGAFHAVVRARKTVPAYTMRGYSVRLVLYGFGDLPMQQLSAPLPDVLPGQEAEAPLGKAAVKYSRCVLHVLRPDGFSVWSKEWKA